MILKLKRREGFWETGQDSRLERPVHYVVLWKGRKKFIKALHKVQNTKAIRKGYKGHSWCRCCRLENCGSGEFNYKGWVWPDGFMHYVVKHNIRPSLAFQEMILGRYVE